MKNEDKKQQPKKAYKAYEVDSCYSTIIFAINASEAKSIAKDCDCCEDAEWINIRVNREPLADSLYKGSPEVDWYDMETRMILVKDLGWSCYEPGYECDTCQAKPFCRWHMEE